LTERPLNGVLQPCRREGPVWIVEPPFSAGERLTVDDPLQPIDSAQSRRPPAGKRTFNSVVQLMPSFHLKISAGRA